MLRSRNFSRVPEPSVEGTPDNETIERRAHDNRRSSPPAPSHAASYVGMSTRVAGPNLRTEQARPLPVGHLSHVFGIASPTCWWQHALNLSGRSPKLATDFEDFYSNHSKVFSHRIYP
jgi:hypothetical protein